MMLRYRTMLCLTGLIAMLTLHGCTQDMPESVPYTETTAATTTEAVSASDTVTSSSTTRATDSTAAQMPQTALPTNINRNNLANGGYAAETDTFRYYIDQDALHRISRTDPDADASILLYLPGIAQLNLYDDNTIFCTAPTGIYRIDTNTGDAQLLRSLTLHTGVWLPLLVAEDTAYYTDGVTLWQSDLTFTAPSICYTAENGAIIDQLVWVEDRLCFSQYTQNAASDSGSDHCGIYCYDGDKVRQTYHGMIQALAVVDSQLYCCDTKQKAVLRMKADGSEQSVLFSGSYGYLCPSPSGWLAMNDAMQLVHCTVDKTIPFAEGYCPNLTADTLYYLHMDTGRLCTMALSEIEAAAARSPLPLP